MSENPYERLADHLGSSYVGAPKTASLMRILEELFTPLEARIACELPFAVQPLPDLAAALTLSEAEILPALETMATKGLIFFDERAGVKRASLYPLAPGTFEMQFMKGEKGPEKTHIARLFDEYYSQSLAKEIHRASIPWARVITVEKEIPAVTEIFPYDTVRQFIDEAPYLALSTCYCRHERELLGEACDAPKDVCIQFGPFAEYLVKRGFAQKASTAEALQALDRAEQAGLVHITNNIQDRINFICNCCGCCCMVLRGITQFKMPTAVAKANFVAVVDADSCNGCESCVSRCQIAALSVPDTVAVIDEELCIGCGICNSVCPTESLSMQRRIAAAQPKRNLVEMQSAILTEKGRG